MVRAFFFAIFHKFVEELWAAHLIRYRLSMADHTTQANSYAQKFEESLRNFATASVTLTEEEAFNRIRQHGTWVVCEISILITRGTDFKQQRTITGVQGDVSRLNNGRFVFRLASLYEDAARANEWPTWERVVTDIAEFDKGNTQQLVSSSTVALEPPTIAPHGPEVEGPRSRNTEGTTGLVLQPEVSKGEIIETATTQSKPPPPSKPKPQVVSENTTGKTKGVSGGIVAGGSSAAKRKREGEKKETAVNGKGTKRVGNGGKGKQKAGETGRGKQKVVVVVDGDVEMDEEEEGDDAGGERMLRTGEEDGKMQKAGKRIGTAPAVTEATDDAVVELCTEPCRTCVTKGIPCQITRGLLKDGTAVPHKMQRQACDECYRRKVKCETCPVGEGSKPVASTSRRSGPSPQPTTAAPVPKKRRLEKHPETTIAENAAGEEASIKMENALLKQRVLNLERDFKTLQTHVDKRFAEHSLLLRALQTPGSEDGDTNRGSSD